MSVTRGERLTASTLAQVRAAELPNYDRSSVPVIAHIGFGAFAKAHLGTYADELLRLGHPALIRGVSIRSRRAQDQLTPQDGLYTVAEREPGEDVTLRVVGALASMETGPAAALHALAAPTTKLVTLTITEKGYEVAREDQASSEAPASAPALIALALARRRRAGMQPPVFASLDNLLDNGQVLRSRVIEAANRFDPASAEWIAREAVFPRSVVDRMVPASTEQDLEDIGSRLGLTDRAAVSAERHRSWTIDAVESLAPFAAAGVELVTDIAPYERRKLWLLNGPHSAVAYCGLLTGCDTIASAVLQPSIAAFVSRLVDEILEVAEFPTALDPARFAGEALRRFANPTLGHTCMQVGADGSSKLPQRFLPVVVARRIRGLDTAAFAIVVAIWIAAAAGIPLRGATLPAPEDPIAPDLRGATSRGGGLHHLAQIALGEHWEPPFVAEVTSKLRDLVEAGPGVLEAPR
jgi:fructuronate reductase